MAACAAFSEATNPYHLRSFQPHVSIVTFSLFADIFSDFINGPKPNPVVRVFQILAQELDRLSISSLVCALANLMTHKDDPSPLLDSLVNHPLHLREIRVIEGAPHGLRQVNDRRIVG
jgi:hypothetical protein